MGSSCADVSVDMNTINKPDRSLVSLFAGCGGSSLGYKQAGFDIKLAVEWDSKAADVYRRNFPETSIFGGDIADLTADEALEITGLQPGELDVLDGSPPCQGFSTAGRRKFGDSRNRLFKEYVRMIDVFKPKMLVMENVSGLWKGKMKLMFAEMTIALKQAGYKVSCRELNAWWYGVPQDRRRLIWIGVREGLYMEPSHPKPTTKYPVSVRDALGHLYDSEHQEVIGIEESYGGIKIGWRSSDKPSGTMPAIRPRRLNVQMRNPDCENINGCVRYLTIEESKTLQGFPAWFQLNENEYKFIGNSVCPPMTEAVGNHLLNLLDTG